MILSGAQKRCLTSLKEDGSAGLVWRAQRILKDSERDRLSAMCALERKYWDRGLLVAGIDEVGRGPLAGPCVAAAVIMPSHPLIEGVNDSKKVSEKKRQSIYEQIVDQAIAVGIGVVDNTVIDKINILNAAKRAFATAYRNLDTTPDFVFCDRIGGIDIDAPYKEFVGGDAISYSIAAASIVAKVTRDEMMREYDEVYPMYGFAQHKGYGTKQHMQVIKENGVSDIHRMTFCRKILS
jgi:ribonuclease HII